MKHPSNPGEVVVAVQVIDGRLEPGRARNIILLLAASVALMMTGFGIILPIFARRLTDFGQGVEALGLMTMAFSLAQFIFAPILGAQADRRGRRPFILLALISFSLINIGYLLAPNAAVFIAMRGLAGALTAGLFPAAMGVVADIMPEEKRGQWVGVVMGGYGVGFILGPVIGGLLYDNWGFAAPFVASAVFAFIAFIAAGILVPETRTPELRHQERLRQHQETGLASEQSTSVWASLPTPLTIFATLLFLDFAHTFAFAFIEPPLVFYLYDVQGWSTVQFGAVIGTYGLSLVLGQATLGRLSDRYGRKPLIVTGVALNATLYFGLVYLTDFYAVLGVAAIAGLGGALLGPAISAFFLDITAEQHRSRVIGIKESAYALGGVAGPLLVVIASRFTDAHGVFLLAGGLTVIAMILALALLREPRYLRQ
jgi:DHA1 family tetracycline resistance protein-like MFS transporter